MRNLSAQPHAEERLTCSSEAWLDDLWAEIQLLEIEMVDDDLFWTRLGDACDTDDFAALMGAVEHWDIPFLLQELGLKRAEEKTDNGDPMIRAALQQLYRALVPRKFQLRANAVSKGHELSCNAL